MFARRLDGLERRIDHWSAGAWEALDRYKQKGIGVALSIQGHHLGLQRGAGAALRDLCPSRLAKDHPLGLRLSSPDHPELTRRLVADGVILPGLDDLPDNEYRERAEGAPAAVMLDVRMLFSALVDADFLETEAHFRRAPDVPAGHRRPGAALAPDRCLAALHAHVAALAARAGASPAMLDLRAELFRACLEAATLPPGLFTLTAPTGSGKTLSMLAFALEHARLHGLRRIVSVLPYLSIIDQTAATYRDVLAGVASAKEVDEWVLEHHSLSGTRGTASDLEIDSEVARRRRELSENWDAPFVVTTSVQLLESLHASRPAACRKLHRLARSVILCDEVQTLPVALCLPTLATLARLAERYGATVLFSTATQPAFATLDGAVRKLAGVGWVPREIVAEPATLFARARRVAVEWPRDLDSALGWDELAGELCDTPQVLCVTNLKRHALRLHAALRERGQPGVFHLSTNLCPAHRRAVLETASTALREGRPCRLVSTQCVEAGVDVDFPVVYRAWGPLEAVAQAAGRANRHGRRAGGRLRVFIPALDSPGERAYPDGAYEQAASVTRILFRERGAAGMDISDPTLLRRYYEQLYGVSRPEHQKKTLIEAIEAQCYAEVAERYRLVERDAINVLVAYAREAYRELADEVRREGVSRSWVARARPHAISLFRPRPGDPVRRWLEPVPLLAGAQRGTAEVAEDWFIYLEERHYSPEIGLAVPDQPDCLIA
ncbi:MAG: DEAD/DEAH box helicase family protein [Candidatus Schekmanbacteria bacterium]|nr:DEAD/DEAH box helicase family protein [Candidatus Schekmanbacteria bacterium]